MFRRRDREVETATPSPGTPGEGRGEGSSSNFENRSISQQNPHPNPLPEYRERGQEAKRIDLHCHSDASNKTSEAVLNALKCPESYSAPAEVYEQAKLRAMDFVTLTDHDSIDGALCIANLDNVVIGEELTCWFPEDHCKMHVLVFGLTREDHDALQSRAKNIYDVSEYIESNSLAHAVAHPIYRQNDKLERWHLERLMLLFKGFECLNGAHSPLHREAFEPLLDKLTKQEISRLSEMHGLSPRWPQPWVKARTGGSDDHGLLNVGRTWTAFPPETTTVQQLLSCLREGNCKPGGEAGSSAKLAHTFYSVAVRYYTRHVMSPDQKPNLATTLLQTIAGEKPLPSKPKLAMMGLKRKLSRLTRRIIRPTTPPAPEPVAGTNLLKKLFLDSSWKQLQQHPQILAAMQSGLPPLGEHERMFELISQVNQDVTRGLAAAIERSIDDASFTGLFDTIGAILAQQFVMIPYYFAVFHQNKERHLLRQITRLQKPVRAETMRIGLFTDTFDEINGVSRFLRDMLNQAARMDRQLIVHTCSADPGNKFPGLSRKNFIPMLSRSLPYYGDLKLNLPPLLEILEWSDRQQFDVIHVSTPGPMGLCGWLVSKMLRVPMVATYHTDFPAYVDQLAGDHRVTNGTTAYMKWFYGQAAAVFGRSASYLFNLRDLGMPEEKLPTLPMGIDLERFAPLSPSPGTPGEGRGEGSSLNFQNRSKFRQNPHPNPLPDYRARGLGARFRLLYCGRVSSEKNLPMLSQIFKTLCKSRSDISLTIAGDGPYMQTMQRELAGLPVRFLGFQEDTNLADLYRNSDLFIFPSRTDTLGQAVMEAQACGLPAIVTHEGGPKETVEHGVTGLVLKTSDPGFWCRAIEELLDDQPRRMLMSHAAAARMRQFPIQDTFESFWNEHLSACGDVLKQPSGYSPRNDAVATTLS